MDRPFDPHEIHFRVLRENDIPLMHTWLNQGEVLKWWGDEPTQLSQTIAEYVPRLNGRGDVLSLIVTYAGEPVGYLQRYYPRDHPDYWGTQGITDDTAGIDLFIGEPAFQHRGLGPMLIRRALSEIVFADPGTNLCLIDPDPANAIAIRAYERVGFRHTRTIGPPDHVDPAYLMVLTRAEFESTNS